MTLNEVWEIITQAGAVAAALVAIGGLLHFTVIRPFKKWLSAEIAKPLKNTADSLQTHNGRTAGEYIENSSNKLDEIEKKIEALSTQLQVTNQLTLQAQAQANLNTERIDKHLRDDHGGRNDPTGR